MDANDLKSVPLFSGLSKRERELVARFADEVDVPAGKVLTKEGGPSQEFFVITSGSATVTREGEEVARLGAGDFFGEIGILKAEPRTATVTADTPCACWCSLPRISLPSTTRLTEVREVRREGHGGADCASD